MNLQIHHVVYIACLDPWMYPDELLLVLCDWHHNERQAVKQAIYVEVGKHLATLSIYELRRQPIYTFFGEDNTLLSTPAWLWDYLRYERDGIQAHTWHCRSLWIRCNPRCGPRLMSIESCEPCALGAWFHGTIPSTSRPCVTPPSVFAPRHC